MSALTQQVGGNHYTSMGMQPFEFTMRNRWDALAHTALKYIVRHGAKGGRQDLLKAAHCVHLRSELFEEHPVSPVAQIIPMADFTLLNGILSCEAEALFALESWVLSNRAEGGDAVAKEIAKLTQLRYP